MQTPWERHEDAAKTQWCLHRLCEVSVQMQTPPAAFLRRPCAFSLRTRRSRGALGDLSALLLRLHCDPTAFLRRAFRSKWERRATARPKCAPWHGVQGDPTASSGVVPAMPRHSSRSHCTHLGVLKFSRTAVQSPWGCRIGVTGA